MLSKVIFLTHFPPRPWQGILWPIGRRKSGRGWCAAACALESTAECFRRGKKWQYMAVRLMEGPCQKSLLRCNGLRTYWWMWTDRWRGFPTQTPPGRECGGLRTSELRLPGSRLWHLRGLGHWRHSCPPILPKSFGILYYFYDFFRNLLWLYKTVSLDSSYLQFFHWFPLETPQVNSVLERQGRVPWDFASLFTPNGDVVCRVGDQNGLPSTEGGGSERRSMVFLLIHRKAMFQA